MPGFLESFKATDPKYYVQSGYEVTQASVTRFALPGWRDGRPVMNATDEQYLDAILQDFREESNLRAQRKGAESESFHPEFWPHLERALADCALRMEARENPNGDSWKEILSLYLRCWASGLNPWALLSAAEILFQQKEHKFARRFADVCSYFPRYWNCQPENQTQFIILSYAMIRDYVPKYGLSDLRDAGTNAFSNELQQDIAELKRKHA